MAAIRPFVPQKLVIPMILAPHTDLAALLHAVSAELGELDFVSDAIAFDFTDYYEPEMGPDLSRRFVSVAELVDPSLLAGFKLRTDALERRFVANGRTVNLDPGILSLSRLILASTKDFSHRIPLRDGIYAEVTLIYSGGRFQALPWTFPDYRTAEYHAVLLHIRESYHADLRATSPQG